MQFNLNENILSSGGTDKVATDFWYTSSDDRSLDLIKDLSEFLTPILDVVKFNPKFVTWNCQENMLCSDKFKEDNCLGNGKYCAMLPQDIGLKNQKKLTGKDVLMEDLRQYCLWSIFDKYNLEKKYFDYVSAAH